MWTPLWIPALLVAGCADARPKNATEAARPDGSCPVVEVPASPPRPDHVADWLVRVGDRVVGRADGLGAWPVEDGAKPSVTWEEDVYPGWSWVLDGDGMVNVDTGRGLIWRGGLKEDALAQGARFEVDEVIGRGRSWAALVDGDAREVHFFRADARSSFHWSVNDDRVEAAALAPDAGAWIGADEWVARFDAAGDEVLRVRAAPITVEEIAVAPDGASVAVMAYEGMVNVLDAETGVARWSWSTDRGAMDFSPDGTRLLVSHHEGSELVDARSGCLLRVLPTWGHVIWLDDRRLAWLDAEGRLQIEDVAR